MLVTPSQDLAANPADARGRYIRIPADLREDFYRFGSAAYRRFLLLINLLGQLAYLFYGLADLYVLPDIGYQSVLFRLAYVTFVALVMLALFRWCSDDRWIEMVLPLSVLGAASVWFLLLSESRHADVRQYQYASVIFIILANLAVQLQFLLAWAVSALIVAVTFFSVHANTQGDAHALMLFALVYVPVVFFSLFISWNAGMERRRAYLLHHKEKLAREELATANRQLDEWANTDALTGVGNRRKFEKQAEMEIMRATRFRQPLSLIMLDIDHFKHINDAHGHETGDRVLQHLCVCIGQGLREVDTLTRIGGEEFAVLLPSTDIDEAHAVAQRLRAKLEASILDEAGHHPGVPYTASFGVACVDDKTRVHHALLANADAALYLAKSRGRNRVERADDSELTGQSRS